MTRMMEKSLFVLTALVLTFFVSCKIVDAREEIEPEEPVRPLITAMANASGGGTVKVSSRTIFSPAAEIVVTKQLTLAGSSYDMKKATIYIKEKGVTLRGLKNLNKVVVGEEVDDDDFTITSCEIETLEVKGGGSHSGHINGSSVGLIKTDKLDVRLVFGGTNRVSGLEVKKECKIETDENNPDSKASIETITVSAGVVKLEISGKQSIGNLITKSDGGAQTQIITGSADIGINKAGDLKKDGSVQPIEMVSSDEKIDIPYFEPFVGTEASEVAEKAKNACLADIIKKIITSVDHPGCISLSAEKYGINVKIDVPDNCNHINIYRKNIETKEPYLVGIYQKSSKHALSKCVNYTDYYVVEDEVYDYYAEFHSNDAGNILKTSETDRIKAVGGSGILQYATKPVLNFDPETFTPFISGEATLTVHGDPDQKADMFYFKRAATKPASTLVESSLYTLISVTENKRLRPAKSCTFGFVSENDIGTELELFKIKTNIATTKGDIKCTWVSIPQDGECGEGFTDNKITFTKDSLPAYFRRAAAGQGVECVVNLSKLKIPYGDEKIYRIQAVNNRSFDNSSYTISPKNGAAFAGNESFVINMKDVNTVNRNCFKTQLYTLCADGNKTATFIIRMYMNSSAGTGENNFPSGIKINGYDDVNDFSSLNVGADKLLKYPVPETFPVAVNGEDMEVAKNSSLVFGQGIMKIDYSKTLNLSYKLQENGKFEINPFSSLGSKNNDFKNYPVYPYKSRVNQAYDVKKNDEVLYKIDYVPVETSLGYIKGLPEPVVFKEAVADPE